MRYSPRSGFVQRSMEQVWTRRLHETVASNFVPRKTVVDSCALHKMLLVVFFHHRALPQLSRSTNTGLSRAGPHSAARLGQGDTECPAMAFINSHDGSRELFPIPVT